MASIRPVGVLGRSVGHRALRRSTALATAVLSPLNHPYVGAATSALRLSFRRLRDTAVLRNKVKYLCPKGLNSGERYNVWILCCQWENCDGLDRINRDRLRIVAT